MKLKPLQKEAEKKILDAFYYDEKRKIEVLKKPTKASDPKTSKGLKDAVTKKLLEIHEKAFPKKEEKE